MADNKTGDDTKKYNPSDSTNKPETSTTPKSKPAKKAPEKKPSKYPIEPPDLVNIIKGELDPPGSFKKLSFDQIEIRFPTELITDTEEEMKVILNLYTGEIRKAFTDNLIPKTKITFWVNQKWYKSSTF